MRPVPVSLNILLEADKRADEATERAARLEAHVRALTDELDARTGYRRVVGESPTTDRFNKSKAAKAIGLTRHQLYIRMRKYGFE